MKKSLIIILNGIVAGICLIALIGYFLSPLLKITAKITFDEALAELIFANEEEEETEEESSEEPSDDEIIHLLIEELVEEEISIDISVSLDTSLLMSSALSSNTKQTEKFIHSLIDDLVETIDKETLQDLEDSIAKASVSAAVKMELQELSRDLDEDVEKIMDDLGIDDSYLDNSTEAILDAIRSEDATVDSVTDEVIDVVKDVYSRFENHPEYSEEYEELTPEAEEELRAEIADIISEFADENGNFNGDGLISSLLANLLSEEGFEEEEEEAFAPAHLDLVNFTILNFASEESESSSEEQEDKPIDEVLADTLKESITKDTLNTIRIISIVLFGFVFFSAFWWILLIIKILAKIGMRNPLISLKAPIIFGALPFIIFVIVPSLFVDLLASPPAFMRNWMGQETVEMLTSLFDGTIKIAFSSSAIVAFICVLATFGFGFYYSAKRRELKRKIREEKLEQMKSGGLY